MGTSVKETVSKAHHLPLALRPGVVKTLLIQLLANEPACRGDLWWSGKGRVILRERILIILQL